ncbi:spindle and kinetochore-associated protein 3 isoform X2 [Lissotriton helveticus]
MAETVTETFFGKLRHLATTLEKETKQLEREFNQEDSDSEEYEDKHPMKVLHELNSDIRTLKGEIQVTVDASVSKEQDLSVFLKACRLLKQRTTSDLEQIQDVFEKYGYKTPVAANSDIDQGVENSEGNLPGESVADELSKRDTVEDKSSVPGLQKIPASGDFLHLPPLSDFGLSQYQFSGTWGPQGDKQTKAGTTRMKDKNCTSKDFSDNLVLSVPKTPSWASSADGMNLNDDYTMALFKVKVPEKSNILQKSGNEDSHALCSETIMAEVPAVPIPPTRLTHNKDDIRSPSVPAFRTPGLKTAKEEGTVCAATPKREDPAVSDDTSTPSLPQFETPWLKKCVRVNKEDTTEDVPKTNKSCPEEPSHLMFGTEFYENSVGLSAPPQFMDYEDFLVTPKRPELPSIMHDFKMLDDNLFGIPQHPKLIASTTEENFKDLSVNEQGLTFDTKIEANTKTEASVRDEKQMILDYDNKNSGSVLTNLALVSESEYSSEPNYLKRQIPLTSVNSSIEKINAVLSRKQMEGELDTSKAVFGEAELKSLLEVGPQLIILLMCLVDLNRLEELEETESKEGRFYRALIQK